ncbi:MAG: glycosyltransferase [Candidatus Promineifilaceae bacterium]
MPPEEAARPLRVCYFGTYRASYVRNQVLIEGLRRQGVAVETCHAPLWRGTPDRIEQASGGWRRPAFWLRVLQAYGRLLWAYTRCGDYDVMLAGYPGQFDVYLARLLTWKRRRPLALDVLMSLHLIAEERGLTRESPLSGRLLFWLEKFGLRLPDLLLADTHEYRDYYCRKYGLPADRFALVPLGLDERRFYPRPDIQPPDTPFRVAYAGTYLPLHGLETMVRAAALLAEQADVQFDFFGDGQERAPAEALAAELGLRQVRFNSWLEPDKVPAALASAHVCLGVFGATQQARFTVQNKIWEAMAMARPVITGDSPTVRRDLAHLQHVYLVEREDPQALAAGICALKDDPGLRLRLGAGGYARSQHNNISSTGRCVKAALCDLLAKRGAPANAQLA